MTIVKLREIAFARSGDKIDTVNLAIIPYNEKYYEILKKQITSKVIKKLVGKLVKGKITRYEFHGIKALNFVLAKALNGGSSRSLFMDTQGKSYASLVMNLDIEINNYDQSRIK